MSVSAMDTAKLPLGGLEAPLAPGEALVTSLAVGLSLAVQPADRVEPIVPPQPARPAAPLTLASVARPVPVPAGRRALREERRQLRRLQRRYAAAGIAVLVAAFLLTVVVLGGIR